MKYSIEVFKRQYIVLIDFIYHYISYKELFNNIDVLQGSNEFWKNSTNAHIKVSIASWCMIFGSEGMNPTHWKKMIIEDKSNTYKEFRNLILKECNFIDNEWDIYWKQVVDYRNLFIVHRDLVFNEPTPNFDISFKIAITYDLWIREKIYPDYLDFPTLYEMSKKYKSDIAQTLSLLLK